PIVSFGILMLAAALRWGLRPYVKDYPGCKAVFDLLGGEVTGRGPAYVATGAIALAFVCSLAGFIVFCNEAHEMHELQEELLKHDIAHAKPHGDDEKDHEHKKELTKAEKEKKAAEDEEIKKDRARFNALKYHWEGDVTWARIYSMQTSDRE